MWKPILGLLLLLVVSSCKHTHEPPSEELQKAYAIQQEALAIHTAIEKSGAEIPAGLDSRKTQWLKDMVEIPGMDHDHSNCNHDHSRQTISISDTEMIAVQQAWKDSIVSISTALKLSTQ